MVGVLVDVLEKKICKGCRIQMLGFEVHTWSLLFIFSYSPLKL